MEQPPPSVPPPTLSYAQPPAGIESKAQTLAVRSLRALGLLCVIVGAGYGALGALFTFASQGLTLGAGLIAMDFVGMGLVGAVGITYLVCAAKIRRGNRTAGLVAMVLASIQEGFALLALLLAIVRAVRLSHIEFLPLGIILFVTLAFGQLIWHLHRFLRPRPIL